MALGKYSRVDGRKSSSGYCSTVTLVVFVALCLVGVWMMTSSSVVPLQNVENTSQETKDEVKTTVSESNEINSSNDDNTNNEANTGNEANTSNEANISNESNTKQFEDNPGDLPEDATKGDAGVSLGQDDKNSGDNSKENTNIPEKTSDSDTDGNSEEKPEKQNAPEETNLEDATKAETENKEEKKEEEETKLEDKDSKVEIKDGEENNAGGQQNSEDGSNKEKLDLNEGEKNSENPGETKDGENTEPQKQEKEKIENDQQKVDASNEILPSGAQSELLKETTTQNGAFSTQAKESEKAKEEEKSSEPEQKGKYQWKVCNVTAGSDYIPCLDNLQAIKNLRTTKHYEHRERHCPDNPPTCLVPLPEGYQRPIEWPTSREKIWYHNVPHTKLAEVKGHQNWVKVSGEYLTFPGGGTQFKHGALHYIDFIQQIVPDIAWGKRSRVILDVGCGVASFGGFLFDRDVLTMSFAPKDEHEAQVQFALERGIPAISAVMGTQRLPFPGRVFDVVHCARCRVPWHIEGGKLLLELNRLLRPGGFFVWSATPVYQKLQEDVEIWEEMKKLTKQMCWEVVSISKDRVNGVGVAVYQKPMSNECYEARSQNEPPLCKDSDDANAAWYSCSDS